MPKAQRRRGRRTDAAATTAATGGATPSGPFRLGVVAGTTPGRWVDRWRERRPEPLSLVPLDAASQRRALLDGDVDAALVRLPIEREGLQLITLYDDATVVVTSADSHLAAADDLDVDDLADQVWLTPGDDVLHLSPPDRTRAPDFAPPATTAEAIATVAAAPGMVVAVPMSLARLHQRRDTVQRTLRGAPSSPVALAWPADAQTAAVDAFIGIVRGRTANSSR